MMEEEEEEEELDGKEGAILANIKSLNGKCRYEWTKV